MKRLISDIFLVAWALWFGGAVAILVLVQHLFQTNRDLAVQAAPQLFLTFEKYQLVLAAVVVLSLFGVAARKRLLATLVLSAAAIAALSACFVTPRINNLRLAGGQGSSAFRMLHGISMSIYLIEVVLLLITGLVLKWNVLKSNSQQEENPPHVALIK